MSLPEEQDDLAPPGLTRWAGLAVLSAFCIFTIWGEAATETDRLSIGLLALVLLVIGVVLLLVAVVKLVRKRAPKGSLIGLAMIAGTLILLFYETPSTLLDSYRLYRYDAPMRETLVRIQKAHPNLDFDLKLERMELNRHIPSDIPPSIAHARFYLYKPAGPNFQNLKQGVVTYGLRVDTIECRIETGSEAPPRCAPIVRWSK